MKRKELITSKEYVLADMQLKLMNLIEDYMKSHNLKRNDLAQKLSVTKGYISQILNVSFDHKLSKIIELSLACNAIPLLYFIDLDRFVKEDALDKIYELLPIQRPRSMTYENESSFVVDNDIKSSQRENTHIPASIVNDNQQSFSLLLK